MNSLTIQQYYRLTKPGIIYGNVITTIAGFLLGSRFHGGIENFWGVVCGTALIIASACVFNNYLDRKIDKKMTRTKNRSLVTGQISIKNALLFGTILGIFGFLILTKATNLLTVVVGLVGYIDYIIFYGISKRTSIYGTIVGSISGATPILAGYTAATNRLDTGAVLVFLVLVLWQMPHFYSIAIYRLKDYTAAELPVLPVIKGLMQTKIHILIFLLAFVIVSLLLPVFKLTGYVYAICMGILGLSWLLLDIQGFFVADSKKWARKMFFFSLITIMVLSVMIPLGVLLP